MHAGISVFDPFTGRRAPCFLTLVVPHLLAAQAAVHHPLWNGGRRCYGRFFGWALGDGALIPMYPNLCYTNWPCSAEACGLLLLVAAAAAASGTILAVLYTAWPLLGAATATSAGLENSSSRPFTALLPFSWASGTAAGPAAAGISLPAASLVLLRVVHAGFVGAVAYKLADMLLDICRAFSPVSVCAACVG